MPYILITLFLVVLVFTLPGLALSSLIWSNSAAKAEKLIFGSAIGLAFSCYISVTIAYFIGWEPFLILVTITGAAILIFALKIVLPDFGGIDSSNEWTRIELAVCLTCVVLVCVFLALIFSKVGLPTESGYRFSWLFGHDFINKAVNPVALTHGVPPPHFYFGGETLRYYILSYSITAVVYSLLGIEYSIHDVVIMFSLVQAVLFLFILTQFLKTWFGNKLISILLALSFLFYSYYGVFFLLKDHFIRLGLPSAVNNFSWVSHLFYRFLLVEPQTVMGLMVFLVVLSVLSRSDIHRYPISLLIVGLLIGFEFGIESTLGMFLSLIYGCVFLLRFSTGMILPHEFPRIALLGAIPVVVIYVTYIGTGIFSATGQTLGLNFTFDSPILASFPFIAFISFGPTSFLGMLGLIHVLRKGLLNRCDAIILSGILAVFFMLTVSHQNEAILGYLKGEKILFIVLLVLSGFSFKWIISRRYASRSLFVTLLCIVTIPALVTPFTDYYRILLSDEAGAVYVSYEDMDACNWIKRNLPKYATVQSEPQYPSNKYVFSLIADFAERKMALGEWKVAGVKHDSGTSQVGSRFHMIKRELFQTADLEIAHKTASMYNIDYIYVGPYERSIYPEHSTAKWKQSNEYFRQVYNANGVSIYRVL